MPAKDDIMDLVRRVNASAFLPSDAGDVLWHPPRRSDHSIVKKARGLSRKQLELVVAILEGRAALIVIAGHQYAMERFADGWTVQRPELGSIQHSVSSDFAHCSCDDHKFRHRDCKHITALRGLLNG